MTGRSQTLRRLLLTRRRSVPIPLDCSFERNDHFDRGNVAKYLHSTTSWLRDDQCFLANLSTFTSTSKPKSKSVPALPFSSTVSSHTRSNVNYTSLSHSHSICLIQSIASPTCTLEHQNTIQTAIITGRSFSSRARKTGNNNSRNQRSGGSKNKQNQGGQPMTNEHLIRLLLQTSSETADSLQVRLIIDRPHGISNDENQTGGDSSDSSDNSDDNPEDQNKQTKKNDIRLVSLAEAISIATENGVDLVGISLQQKVPVLRAIDFSKFLYEQSAKESKRKKSIQKQAKANKEFTFRAGIDKYDLERKTKNMVSYLEKGHSCQVTITSNRRNLMNDQGIITTTLSRVQEYIGEYGNAGKLKTNPFGNRGSILFQPKSKK